MRPDGSRITDPDPDDFVPDGAWGSANQEAQRAIAVKEAQAVIAMRIALGEDPHTVVGETITGWNKPKKKKRKKVVRVRKSLRTIFIVGQKNYNVSYKKLKTTLEDLVEEFWPERNGWFIIGTNRPLDDLVVSACKELKFNVMQVPANFLAFSGASAEQIRNGLVLEAFKPETVVLFTKDVEQDSVVEHLYKIAKRRVPVKVIQ